MIHRTTIVVAERGSDWPSWLAECCVPGVRETAVTQDDHESPLELSYRVTQALEERGSDPRLGIAVIACNNRCDEAASHARRTMARSLASALAAHGGGQLWVTTLSRSGRSRHALSSFVQALSEEWAEAGVNVGIRFGDQAGTSATDSAAAVFQSSRVA